MNRTHSNSVSKKIHFAETTYYSLIESEGLKKTWLRIINLLSLNGEEWFNDNIVDFCNIGRLYEVGLAYVNKKSKKDSGQYYTPQDVSKVMANFFVEKYTGGPICDVACGCGNLIIEVLSTLKIKKPNLYKKIINDKLIYLYDNDALAMTICINKIKCKFDIKDNNINKIHGDFLNKKVLLPSNCSVITNPPYARMDKFILEKYKEQKALQESKDYYVGFLSKCILFSQLVVFVAPQSFLVGHKFSTFRKELATNRSGEIYVFDNMPSQLFNGKKEGIFNTNTSNGVRASICCSTKTSKNCGYRITPLIRFISSERKFVINNKYLISKLGKVKQNLTQPLKCDKSLEKFVYSIKKSNNIKLKDLFSQQKTNYPIYISNSARYYISATKTKLNRKGFYCLYAKSKQDWDVAYSLLNSSYCYLWWRMLDGGILLPKSLLLNIEIPKKIYARNKQFSKMVALTVKKETKYLHYKKNAGEYQETVKLPLKMRLNFNKILFPDVNENDFNVLHSNKEIFNDQRKIA